MKFIETAVAGAYLIELERIEDERGFFARVFCHKRMREAGLNPDIVQMNLSFNAQQGTVRGMHFQVAPALETKLVRCTNGAILDQIVDMRADSPTYLEHVAVELTAANRLALYVPAQCAHGFQTLEDDTEVFYGVSGAYAPEHEQGLRHDDPALKLSWPLPVSSISDKDASWPLMAMSDSRLQVRQAS